MTAGIRVRWLRLRGAGRVYDVSFVDENEEVRPLSVIAGQIATGKTSVLEFVDYCLGASRHPRHPEIERRARTALLEIELGSDIFVIERPLGTFTKAYVHHSTISEMADTAHVIDERTFRRASDPDSLSRFLLDGCELAGRELKQAPTQEASAVDPLSFRDLSDLYFLPHRRLDNGELLHERHQPRRLKLRQTLDGVFGAHDDALVAANARLEEVRDDIAELETEIDTIVAFLAEQGVDEDADLGADISSAEGQAAAAQAELIEIEQSMEAETTTADELREVYGAASNRVAHASATVRDRETLLGRLGALRAQYADDLSKLRFAAEAGRLLDPLALTACPSCLQALDGSAGPVDGECGLCSQSLESVVETSPFDVSKEIRATEAKLRELGKSMDEIDAELAQVRTERDENIARRDIAQAELDAAVSARLAPFVAQRDVIQGRLAGAEQQVAELSRTRRFVAGIDDRRKRLSDLGREEERIKSRVQRLKDDGQDHTDVITALSSRFGTILADFNFPKLDDPHLDDVFVPRIRGMRYADIGSAGASTLISLAWHLAILEEATDQDAAHPGFLMIDSPQKNLMTEDEPDFDGELIADAIYGHLIDWSNHAGADQQLIIVDNSPRPAAEPHIVVRFSGDPDRPPYGLIDDEIS